MQETNANELSETEEYDTSTKITLKDGLGYMHKRKKQFYVSGDTNFKQSHKNHSKLILFYPWKNEDDLITGFNSYM